MAYIDDVCIYLVAICIPPSVHTHTHTHTHTYTQNNDISWFTFRLVRCSVLEIPDETFTAAKGLFSYTRTNHRPQYDCWAHRRVSRNTKVPSHTSKVHTYVCGHYQPQSLIIICPWYAQLYC